MRFRQWFLKAITLSAAAIFVVLFSACQQQASPLDEPSRHVITVFGFSVEEEIMTEEIYPAFVKSWQLQSGDKISFRSVFTSSDAITEAIIDGTMADVAILSNEQHAIWLHINDKIQDDWRSNPYKGIVTLSPMVIVVREGNPLNVQDWVSLTKPGIEIIHPDPQYSGAGQWALLAEYGSALLEHSDPLEAQEQVRLIKANIVSSPDSARNALKEYLFGKGDVLITYEQDALLAQSRGAEIEIVMPPRTIISENVIVALEENGNQRKREAVAGFVDFLWSDVAQRAFTRYFFRSITNQEFNQAVPEFLTIEQPFSIQDLGGWGKAYPEIIKEVWEDR